MHRCKVVKRDPSHRSGARIASRARGPMLAEPLLDRIASTGASAACSREFPLAVGAVPSPLFDVMTFQGEETMSELYAFDVVAGVDPATAEVLRIGDPARLNIPTPGLG